MFEFNIGKCFLILLFLVFTSCERDPPLYEIDNLNGNRIDIFGHAGMGQEFKYPFNTYESIEPLLRSGADGTEMDIQMTRDSVLVLFHNEKLEELTPCTTGRVNDKNWPDIWGCHVASPISYTIKLISFEELLDMLEKSGKNIHDYTFTFDCKLYRDQSVAGYMDGFANAILYSANRHGILDRLFIESQDTAFLTLLKSKQNGLQLFYYPPNFTKGLEIAKRKSLFGITMNSQDITAEQIKEAHRSGVRVALWGLSTERENIDAVNKSPDFIQTDKPIHLLMYFDRLIK